MPITAEQLAQREVHCCLSSLVSTLASGYGATADIPSQKMGGLSELAEQAFELASPVLDYEEALCQNHWRPATKQERELGFWDWQCVSGEHHGDQSDRSPDVICAQYDIEPYEWEVYEHWAVSTWLAEKLIEQGEKVDTDFAGMSVWARTCSGQGIASDGVIERIHAELIK